MADIIFCLTVSRLSGRINSFDMFRIRLTKITFSSRDEHRPTIDVTFCNAIFYNVHYRHNNK